MLFALGRSSAALDDGAALLASVACDSCFRYFQFLEIVALAAGSIEAFRAIAVAQLVARDGQVAVAAAQRFFPFRQKFKRCVITRTHGNSCWRLGLKKRT